MYEVIEKFESYLKSKGFVVHEQMNQATGQRVISWIHESKLIAGSVPASYFDRYYKDDTGNGADEKSIGATTFQLIIDKFTEEF